MDKVNVREFIKMFVAVSYLQERKIFSFSEIYKYLKKVNEGSLETLAQLTNEVDLEIEEMLNDGTLSCVYPDEVCGLYRIGDRINYKEIVEENKDVLEDIVKVFLDICGGKPYNMSIVPTKSRQKNKPL